MLNMQYALNSKLRLITRVYGISALWRLGFDWSIQLVNLICQFDLYTIDSLSEI